MLIAGEWLLGNDLLRRPVVRAQVVGADGRFASEYFLLESGADRTVFRARLVTRLGLVADPSQGDVALVGVGGATPFVTVAAVLELPRDDGGPARVRGQFAAFTDQSATDLSILGRDVMDNLDLIISRRRDQVLLLATNHQYRVTRT